VRIVSCAGGFVCCNRKTRCRAGQLAIYRRRTCRENDLPLVRELAAAGAPIRVPVTVTCRVLKIARQPYYRWLAEPVTDAEWVQAHRANALFDAHRDDPEFGYRFPLDVMVDVARENGQSMVDRTAWRICSANGWWSVFGKRKRYGKARKAGAPAHDDLVAREFTAPAPNRLWLTDITEHRTDEGKLYLCAVKDVWSNRIVGYSIDSRMKSRLGRRSTRQRGHPQTHRRPNWRGRCSRLHPAFRPRVSGRIQLVVATPRDHGGVRWFVDSKRQIERCGRR